MTAGWGAPQGQAAGGDAKAIGPRIRRDTERKVLKGIFGAPRPRSVSFDFRHDAGTSVWHKVVDRAHLIVAAVGTIALLGLAGTAIWLALPSQSPGALAKASAASAKQAAAAAPLVVEEETPAAQNADELRQQAAPDGAQIVTLAETTVPDPLAQADPRWTSTSSRVASKSAKPHSLVVNDADEGADEPPLAVNAYAGQDKSATAAISAKQAIEAVASPEGSKPTEGSRPGQATQAVTMRSKPSSRGSVLGTVPGNADVEVVSCDSWCEIIYNGKRGFVYKRFLKEEGR